MRVELLADFHKTWCPKGTIGILANSDWPKCAEFPKFYPDEIVGGSPWTNGIYIGDIKYKIITTIQIKEKQYRIKSKPKWMPSFIYYWRLKIEMLIKLWG